MDPASLGKVDAMTTTRAPRGFTRPVRLPMPAHVTINSTRLARCAPQLRTRLTRELPFLGGTVALDLRGVSNQAGAGLALEAAGAWLRRVDAVFGPHRESAVSRLRRDRRVLDIDEPLVEDVLIQCEQAWSATAGWFDPWALEGGFNPAGLINGWALGPVADLLANVAAGLRVEAAGDVVVRGERAPGVPWGVAVRRPDGRTDLTAVLDVHNLAVSTSNGRDVVDPATGAAVQRLRSATVVGPDAARTDAYATALVASGPEGLQWLAPLRGYEAYLVDLDGVTLSTPGLPRRAA